MALEIDDLIVELTIYAPQGAHMPRGPDDTEVNVELIERWAKKGAKAINQRRRKTTGKEVVITLVADQYEYDLPENARHVNQLVRHTNAPQSRMQNLGIPHQGSLLYGSARLPTGQEISPSLDLIFRQRVAYERREDDYEIFDGKLRILFPAIEGEEIVLRYEEIDESLESVPEHYRDDLMLYLRYRLLDQISAKGVSTIVDGDALTQGSINEIRREASMLYRQWIAALNSIGPEV